MMRNYFLSCKRKSGRRVIRKGGCVECGGECKEKGGAGLESLFEEGERENLGSEGCGDE